MTAGLLPRPRGKLAVADADREAFDEFLDRFLAIGSDQLGHRREQAGLRETIAVDAVMARFRPCLAEIANRLPLLLMVGHGLAGEAERHRMAHNDTTGEA